MDSFEFADQDAAKVTKKVTRLIRTGPMKSIVKFIHKTDQIEVVFSQFGTSKIFYDVEAAGEGFKAKKSKEKVMFTHKAFRKEVEKYLSDILKRIGAKFT